MRTSETSGGRMWWGQGQETDVEDCCSEGPGGGWARAPRPSPTPRQLGPKLSCWEVILRAPGLCFVFSSTWLFQLFCPPLLITGFFTDKADALLCWPAVGSSPTSWVPPHLKGGPPLNASSDPFPQTSARTWRRSFPSCRQRTSAASTSVTPPPRRG